MACGHDLADTLGPTCEQASARHDELTLFRIYGADELGPDGYPFAWHQAYPPEAAEFLFGTRRVGIKDLVRAAADNRTERGQQLDLASLSRPATTNARTALRGSKRTSASRCRATAMVALCMPHGGFSPSTICSRKRTAATGRSVPFASVVT